MSKLTIRPADALVPAGQAVNGKKAILHLLKQLDREEKQYRAKLESGLYHWMDSVIIQAHLGKIKRFRAQYGEASGDKQPDASAN